MEERSKKIWNGAESLAVGALHLEINEFGDTEETCLKRIEQGLVPAGTELPVCLYKEEDPKAHYDLMILKEGITIRADAGGIFPALSELQSLIFKSNGLSCLPLVRRTETARFSYRGVMVDEARHFQGPALLKELLEIMFRLKFNVLHWHLSDDQGFRIPLPGYPELTKAFRRNSSNRGGYFRSKPNHKPYEASYTDEQVREILLFAKERGIRVIPEIDMPGHFSAVLACYPQYACGAGGSMAPKEVPGGFGVLGNALCLGKKEAREFAKKLALDTARYLGSDAVHIGFDEIRTDHMRRCPDCQREAQRRGLKDSDQLIPLFREEVRDYLTENGVHPMAWNEESAFDDPDPQMTLIHWHPETNKQAVERIDRGQKMVISDFYHYYLDYPYCMTSLKKTYEYEPVLKEIKRPENVIGTECTIWTEYIYSPEKFRMNVYYRLAAAAKTAWCREKPSYPEFLKELREKEAYWFGEKLAIPDQLLDPPFWTRIRRLWKCLLRDSQYEIKVWKQG